MFAVLSITGTIFFIISIGYVAVSRKLFPQEGLQVLGRYVVNLALPALIFKALSERGISEISNIGYMGGYLFGSLTVLITGYILSRYIWRTKTIAATFDAAGMACANSGFVGYPLLVMALPTVAPTALALNMLVENLIIIPLLLILAERAVAKGLNRGSLVLQIVKRIFKAPLILAMFAGVCVAFADITLPFFVTNSIDLIAQSSVAVSLFVIGGTVAGISLRNFHIRLLGVVMGKLVLLPAAVWLGFAVIESIGLSVGDEELREAAIIMAATPAMTIYPILAQRYGQEEHAAAAMLVMTGLSFFTISGVLFIF